MISAKTDNYGKIHTLHLPISPLREKLILKQNRSLDADHQLQLLDLRIHGSWCSKSTCSFRLYSARQTYPEHANGCLFCGSAIMAAAQEPLHDVALSETVRERKATCSRMKTLKDENAQRHRYAMKQFFRCRQESVTMR